MATTLTTTHLAENEKFGHRHHLLTWGRIFAGASHAYVAGEPWLTRTRASRSVTSIIFERSKSDLSSRYDDSAPLRCPYLLSVSAATHAHLHSRSDRSYTLTCPVLQSHTSTRPNSALPRRSRSSAHSFTNSEPSKWRQCLCDWMVSTLPSPYSCTFLPPPLTHRSMSPALDWIEVVMAKWKSWQWVCADAFGLTDRANGQYNLERINMGGIRVCGLGLFVCRWTGAFGAGTWKGKWLGGWLLR